MDNQKEKFDVLERLDQRLETIDEKLNQIKGSRKKSMEWIGQLAEHIRSLDDFREEVRASFEPIRNKLDGIDEVMRIMRHATNDVCRRIDHIETDKDYYQENLL